MQCVFMWACFIHSSAVHAVCICVSLFHSFQCSTCSVYLCEPVSFIPVQYMQCVFVWACFIHSSAVHAVCICVSQFHSQVSLCTAGACSNTASWGESSKREAEMCKHCWKRQLRPGSDRFRPVQTSSKLDMVWPAQAMFWNRQATSTSRLTSSYPARPALWPAWPCWLTSSYPARPALWPAWPAQFPCWLNWVLQHRCVQANMFSTIRNVIW